jgi:ferritin-like protein
MATSSQIGADADGRAQLKDATEESHGGFSRRAFLASGVAVGVGAGLGPFGGAVSALAEKPSTGKLTDGDAAILRFLATAEILETDFWQQYNELGGIQDSELPGGSGSKRYTEALEVLDGDMPQYIHDNTEDELTHFTFLNAYLESRGAEAVDLKDFATLPSSKATGAQQIGRLTNLMQLTVDTSWWTRYRSHTKNPDLGDSFAQAVPGLAKGEHPAIPRSDADLAPENHIQAIANTAGFHFATIEQGGTSLYPALAQRVTDPEVLRVVLSIGPTEAFHFQTWQDKAGNAPAITDPETGLEFPNLKVSSDEELKANLIMPEPTVFLRKSLPIVSIIRPTATQGIAKGVVEFLTAMGLLKGQSEAFFDTLKTLAAEADAANNKRGGGSDDEQGEGRQR